MSQHDPIRRNYYRAVQIAENSSDCLFLLCALLSFCPLLIDNNQNPQAYEDALLLFGMSVVVLFILGIILRLHLVPRAEDKRRQDFFGSACNVSLTYQKTDGYYNNDFTDAMKRMAAQVLENSLFTKEITFRMAWHERIKASAYLLLWLVLLHFRRTDLGWIVAASQAIFSEQILSKWLRLEWLRVRAEKTFDDVFRLFQSRLDEIQFTAGALNSVSMYESAKATASITLSSRIFDDLNPDLSSEWNTIRESLKI